MWKVRKHKEKINPRAGSRCPDMTEALYKRELRSLNPKALTESDVKKITELIDFRFSRKLDECARNWLARFPEHDAAPRLVGRWLENSPTDEVMNLAAQNLRTSDTPRIASSIVEAVSLLEKPPEVLVSLVESRLERKPSDFYWSYLRGGVNKESERLILKWISLCQSDPSIGFALSFTVLSATSKEVIAAVLAWMDSTESFRNEATPAAELDIGFILQNLVIDFTKYSPDFKDEIERRAREWILKNPEEVICSLLLKSLVCEFTSEENIKIAEDWYKTHAKVDYVKVQVLGLILRATIKLKKTVDPYIIEQAQLVSSNAPSHYEDLSELVVAAQQAPSADQRRSPPA